MKDLGSFGPQPDMVFSETSAAASLTLRGWGRKRGTGSISTGHTAAIDSAGSWTINTDQQLLSGKSHIRSNNRITLRPQLFSEKLCLRDKGASVLLRLREQFWRPFFPASKHNHLSRT